MRNRFAGPCRDCGKRVEAGEGYFERQSGHWAVRHVRCTAMARRAGGKPLSAAQAAALEAQPINRDGADHA